MHCWVVYTAWKLSKCGVFLVRIFLHLDWIRRDTKYQSECGKIRTRKNSVFGHISHNDILKLHTPFSVKGFFSNCEKICRKLQICSHLLRKSLMENFVFCAVQFKQSSSLYSGGGWYMQCLDISSWHENNLVSKQVTLACRKRLYFRCWFRQKQPPKVFCKKRYS